MACAPSRHRARLASATDLVHVALRSVVLRGLLLLAPPMAWSNVAYCYT